jgi:methionine sulfoxide reductase heme-binding subunit
MVPAAAAMGIGLAGLALAIGGIDQHGTEVGLRLTAALAFPFLAIAYAAPALAVLAPGGPSARLLARRRSLWLAFGAIFAVHLALIGWLLSLPPDPTPPALVLAFGGIAYALLAAIELTSFEAVPRRLDAAWVRGLALLGEHWVFAVFTVTLLNGATSHSRAWLPALAIALAIYAIRLAAWLRVRRPRAGASAENEVSTKPTL